jgi:hypothetical protein
VKRAFLAAATAAISALVVLVLAEGLLRASGHAPHRAIERVRQEPLSVEADPVLGWRSQAGHAEAPSRTRPGEIRRKTVLADGRRITGGEALPPGGEVVVLGCSYTHGHGLSDEESWPWLLQEQLPRRPVLNYGTSGFGTYQSLLMLERVLPGIASPSLVLYGFIAHHERRNVGDPRWLRHLDDPVRRGLPAAPWVWFAADGGLTRHAPEAYRPLPLHGWLALPAYLEEARDERVGSSRSGLGTEVALALMREMNALARSRGAVIGVVMLVASPGKIERYRAALEPDGALVLPCRIPESAEHWIPNDLHPNAAGNAVVARCVAAALRERPGWTP